MSFITCNELPDQLNKKINPFEHVTTSDLELTHEKYELIRENCNYYSNANLSSALDRKHINILHTNVRSILSDSKFEEFQHFVKSTAINWHVVCVSESWLSDSMIPLRQLPGYTGYFKNRQSKMGGGIIIYVNDEYIIKSSEIHISDLSQEILMIQCQISSKFTFIVSQVYKPPDADHELFMKELIICLEKIDELNKTAFLCGDFNLDLFLVHKDSQCHTFFNKLLAFGYLPTISKTTRFSDNKLSLIDNIFCNTIDFISKSGIIYDDISDHFPIFVSCATLSSIRSKTDTPCLVFDKSKMDDLSHFITEELCYFDTISDPNEACTAIISAYQRGIDKYSKRVTHNRKYRPIKPWITPAILASINRKHTLFVKKCKNQTAENMTAYVTYRNKLNEVIRSSKRMYFQNQLEINKTNSKKMWQLLNSITKGNKINQPISLEFTLPNGDTIDVKEDIAKSFNQYFINVGEQLQQNIPPSGLDPFRYIDPRPNHSLIPLRKPILMN